MYPAYPRKAHQPTGHAPKRLNLTTLVGGRLVWVCSGCVFGGRHECVSVRVRERVRVRACAWLVKRRTKKKGVCRLRGWPTWLNSLGERKRRRSGRRGRKGIFRFCRVSQHTAKSSTRVPDLTLDPRIKALIFSSTCLIGVFILGESRRAAGLGGRLEAPGRPLP